MKERRRVRRIWLRILRWSVPIALVLATLLSSGLLLSYRVDRNWNQDESISFLESTCHLGAFKATVRDRTAPFGAWADASEWQRFIRNEGQLCLGQIARDLAEQDVHPPLYFWLLHLWTLRGDTTFMASFGLNLVLAALTMLALYALGRRVFASRIDGVALALVASMNPVASYAGREFRPYVLLGLLTVLYVLALVRALPASAHAGVRRGRALWLAAATAFGVLTHYLFAYVLLSGAVLALVRLLRRPRQLLQIGAASVLGLAVALLTFPVIAQITSNREYVEPDQWKLEGRLKRLAKAFGMFEPPFEPSHLIVAGAVGLCVLILCLAFNRLPRAGFTRTRGLYVLLFAALLPASLTLLYYVGMTPVHAMTPKYLAAVWPMVGLFAAAFWRQFGRQRFAVAAALCTLCATSAYSRVDGYRDRLFDDPGRIKEKLLIIDNVSRTGLPMMLSRLKPDARVFVADPGFLLETDGWATDEDFTYLSCVRDRDATQRVKALVERFRETHKDRRRSRIGLCWYSQRFRAR